MTEIVFRIGGMSCAACSSGIERSLRRKEGIIFIEINLIQESAKVKFDAKKISLEEIFGFIEKLGYEPYKETKEKKIGILQSIENHLLTPKIRIFLAIIFSLLVLYLSMFGPMFGILPHFLEDFKINASLQLLITLIVMHLGRDFYLRGFRALIHKNPNMDSLVALGSGASFAYSLFVYVDFLLYDSAQRDLYFEGVCVILTFILIGKFLEHYAKNNALRTLDSMLDFYENKALKLVGATYQETQVKDLLKGDRLRVLPGSIVPLDGILLEDYASLDESMLSGEGLPIPKRKGDELLGGSVNVGEVFVMEVTREHTKSTMAQVLNLVRQAQNDKASIARIADSVSAYFVPFVICIAIGAGIFWYQEGFAFALKVFISVLVVSCPCALGLATPMAILIGSIKASKNALLFKNARALENAHKMDCIVFDKTGTLTQGALEIIEIEVLDTDFDEERILTLAGSLEVGSFHPIAKAILKETKKRN